MAQAQTSRQLATSLRLDASERKAFADAARDIASNYNKDHMRTPEFLYKSGSLFDPKFVSEYSSYVVLPPANEPGQPDRSTELVCKNVILSLLGSDVTIIHMFLLKLLRSCKNSVGPAYAVSSMKNALLGVPEYDVVFQVSLNELRNLVDDPVFDESDWTPSTASDAASSASSARSADSTWSVDSVDGLPLEPGENRPKKLYSAIDHDPDKDEESYAGLSITPLRSEEFFNSSISSIEDFYTKIDQITDAKVKVNALVGSIVGFLISQIGESTHPLCSNQPSVNLVCADIIDGIAGTGQALILIFLMAALMKNFLRVYLELASNVMNIAGLCLYSKFFKVDYQLLHEYHAGTLFYDPGNLPMSMEFSEIDAFLQGQGLPPTLINRLNYIIWLCTRSPNKHPLCSIGMVTIQIQVGTDLVVIDSAQREAAATQFMIYLVETIGACIAKGPDSQWRDRKIFKDLIASAVRNAIALEGTLHDGVVGKVPPDPNGASRSKIFCDRLQEAVLVNPKRFNKVNCWSGPNPAREDFHLNRTCIKPVIDATDATILSNLRRDLTAYLDIITANHVPVTMAAARDKKRLTDAAAAAAAAAADAAGNPILNATERRDQRAKLRNEKKAKASSTAATTPLAGHAHALSGFSSAPDFQQQQQQQVGAPPASPAFAGIASPAPGFHQFQQQQVGAPSALQPRPPKSKSRTSLGTQAAANTIQQEQDERLPVSRRPGAERPPRGRHLLPGPYARKTDSGGKKQTKTKSRKGGKSKPKTKRRAANKKKAHAGRVSRHNKVFRRKTRKSK